MQDLPDLAAILAALKGKGTPGSGTPARPGRAVTVAGLAAALAVTACGTEVSHSVRAPVELMLQIEQFFDTCREPCNTRAPLVVQYSDTLSTERLALGLCNIQWNGTELWRTITLQTGMDLATQEWVFEHELQHCVRFQRHEAETAGNESKLMYPFAVIAPSRALFLDAKGEAHARDQRLDGF
jgi:hypothetical protein